jgi:hypothetical protein
MKTLIFGSNHNNTACAFTKFNLLESTLVNNETRDYTVGHTSRQEFTTDDELAQVLSTADVVLWASPDPTEFISVEVYHETLEWLKTYNFQYNNVKNISGITFDPYKWKLDLPILDKDDAVFLGCSFTAGIGLHNVSDRYSTLVSEKFGLNCVNLSKGGGSNNRSFDVFSQLEFHPGQLVVLQLTNPNRLRYCNLKQALTDVMFSHPLPETPIRALLEVYNKDFLLYELLVKLRMAITIAREKHLRFVFWLISYEQDHVYSNIDQLYFYEFDEFIPANLIQNYHVDFGYDNLHPGTESNILIANAITKHIKQIYKYTNEI